MTSPRRWFATLLVGLAAVAAAQAQQPATPAAPPVTRAARQAAQVDLTGFWVAQITEDWRWRMMTPP